MGGSRFALVLCCFVCAIGPSAAKLADDAWAPDVPESCGVVEPGELGGTPKGRLTRSPTTEERERDARSRGIELPTIVSKPRPDFPWRAGILGPVVLSVVICEDGTVGGLRVLRSPSVRHSKAATEAVRQWVYTPAIKDGRPVAVQVRITVDFRVGE